MNDDKTKQIIDRKAVEIELARMESPKGIKRFQELLVERDACQSRVSQYLESKAELQRIILLNLKAVSL